MNDNTNTSTTNQAQGASPKTPSHLVYHVREFDGREGKKSFWTRIGSAWAHADGKGFNAQVESSYKDKHGNLNFAGVDRQCRDSADEAAAYLRTARLGRDLEILLDGTVEPSEGLWGARCPADDDRLDTR